MALPARSITCPVHRFDVQNTHTHMHAGAQAHMHSHTRARARARTNGQTGALRARVCVGSNESVSTIACGTFHTAVVLSNGDLFTFGSAGCGQVLTAYLSAHPPFRRFPQNLRARTHTQHDEYAPAYPSCCMRAHTRRESRSCVTCSARQRLDGGSAGAIARGPER